MQTQTLKRHLLCATVALFSCAWLQAQAAPQDELTAAAKKLADKDNYSWKQETVNAGGGGFGAGQGKGKVEKDGYLWLSLTMRDNTIEAVKKGDKGALKFQDEWQSLSEAAGGDPGPATFLARRLENYKAPAAQAGDLAAKTKDLKQEGEVYSGALTEDGAKSQLLFGGRGGANGPEVSGAKGAVKFWVKDGVLSKYEIKVQGKVSFNGNERDVDRTTTVEIQDVGSTKLEVPEDAKKKLS